MKLKRRHCLSSELLILFVYCSSPCTPNSIRMEIYWIYPQKRTISTSFNAYNLIPRSCLKTHCKKVLSCSNWWRWNHFSLASMLSNFPHTNNASSYFRASLSNLTFHLWIPISVWQQAYVGSSAHLSPIRFHDMMAHTIHWKPSWRPCLIVRETKCRRNESICL